VSLESRIDALELELKVLQAENRRGKEAALTAELAALPPSPEEEPDADGHCKTCGVEWEDGVTHVCPPGFMSANHQRGRLNIGDDDV